VSEARARAAAVAGPNAEQIGYWNEVAGPRWVALQPMLDAQISPLGERAMEAAGVGAGERVLDVGCGCGQSSLQLAERAGPRGPVLGVDVSAPMLARAQERAREADAANLLFRRADAQVDALGEASFDLVFSRFGVMFFADPEAAFANLRRALAPGGRLAFVCWQGLAHNPWMLVPLAAIAAHVRLPPAPAPGAPGPFSFADAERVCAILRAAGLREIECAPLEGRLRVGGEGDLDAAVDFALQMGPAAAALREAGEAARPRAAAAVRDALAPYADDGGVCMDYSAWIVSARR
jgi:SAM-dependent methyltransferase